MTQRKPLTPEQRARIAERARERYANDPEHRKHLLAYRRAWAAAHPESERERRRRPAAVAHRRDHHRVRYATDPEYKLRRDAAAAKYQREHRELGRAKHLRRAFGISAADYDAMLLRQQGVCAICGEPELAITKNGKQRRLAVDHDRRTGAVRGLLCGRCNPALGHFRDRIDLLLRAITYLNDGGVAS